MEPCQDGRTRLVEGGDPRSTPFPDLWVGTNYENIGGGLKKGMIGLPKVQKELEKLLKLL